MWSKENTFRIGIDKISLYNFQIQTDKNFLNKAFTQIIENKVGGIREKIVIKDKFFSLFSSHSLFEKKSGVEESFYNKITFNPNVLLTGDNICNSSTDDLSKAIEKLKILLKEKGILSDFSEAKIADIEINLNIPIDFNEYYEISYLFLKALNKTKKIINGVTDSESLSDTEIKESLFLRMNKSTTFKMYSKTREKNLTIDITRMEYFLETSAYKYFFEKYGKDNSLKTLLENSEMLETLFIEKIKKDFLLKAIKYIETKIKPVLEREYLRFKNTNKLARKNGRKEERNVYRYLEKSWIFDYSFLIEIVGKYDLYHKSRETETIIKRYSHCNNLKKLNYLMDFIFNLKKPKSG